MVALSTGMISFARALICLSRSRRTGVLALDGGAESCRVSVVDGIPRAATAVCGAEDTLGDALLRAGELDCDAHLKALQAGGACRPVGAWLVEVGAASRPAVESALREQLRSRMVEVFRWPSLRYRFTDGQPDVGVPLVAEPVAVADLVLDAVRRSVAGDPSAYLRRHLGGYTLRTTAPGKSLLEGAALWPEEAALASLLAEGCELQTIADLTGHSGRALRLLYALHLMGAVTTGPARSRPFTLLVAKRQQLRAAASAAALLELPEHPPPGEARKALRRLARQLHPDRLGSNAPPALRQACTEMMSVLASAETEIRVAKAVSSAGR